MEDKWRGFREIPIEELSVQKGRDRFSFTFAPEIEAPKPLTWRNNLTALSQCHNLYFVAIQDQLHVYQPGFPTQTLSQVALIISLPVTEPHRPGYINPRVPHGVNHLVVGNLGSEEMIVLACDDGDIIAYTTRSIIIRLAEKENAAARTSAHTKITPWFHHNVSISAWGIALHATARIIAVSANNHEIIVFGFALQLSSDRNDDDSETDDAVSGERLAILKDHDNQYFHQRDRLLPIDRSQNIEIYLGGHLSNIPNISFSNTDGDRSGRYLTSIDILGKITIWDIWKQRAITRFYGFDDNHNPFAAHSETRGWNVVCLEPSSFKQTVGDLETFGCVPVKSRKRLNRLGISGDISASRCSVRNSSLQYPDYNLPVIDFVMEVDRDDQSEEDEHEDDGDRYMDFSSDSSEVFDPHLTEQDLDSEASGEAEQIRQLPKDYMKIDMDYDAIPYWHQIWEIDGGRTVRIRYKNLRQSSGMVKGSKRLPFSLLYTTKDSVGLLGNPHRGVDVFLDDVLKQETPPELDRLVEFSRLNMSAQIPEFGLVVIACQVGRVALLTTTQGKGRRKPGMRLDWMLPFKSQEEKGDRPNVPLIGIAVGPIQGRLFATNRPEETLPGEAHSESWRKVEPMRRYRLMLTYLDQTVLSYEIGRLGPGQGDPAIKDDYWSSLS